MPKLLPSRTHGVATMVWLVLILLGSPLLPDARFAKIGVIYLLLAYLVIQTRETRATNDTKVVLFLQISLIFLTTLSALLHQALVPQRVLLAITALICCLVFSKFAANFIVISFCRAAVLILSIGWLITLLGKVQGHLKSNFGLLGLPYRYSGLMDTPNGAGLLALLTLALVSANWRQNKLTISICLISILGAEYRGGLLALVAMLFWQIFQNLGSAKSDKALSAYLKIMLFVPSIALVLLNVNFSRNEAGDETTGRSLIWKQCQNYISQQDFLGGGPEFIARVVGLDTRASNAATGSFQFFHCHNQILNDIVDFGYITMICSLTVVICLIYLSIRQKNMPWQFVGVAFLISGMFESPIKYLGVQGTLWPLALLWGGLITLTREDVNISP